MWLCCGHQIDDMGKPSWASGKSIPIYLGGSCMHAKIPYTFRGVLDWVLSSSAFRKGHCSGFFSPHWEVAAWFPKQWAPVDVAMTVTAFWSSNRSKSIHIKVKKEPSTMRWSKYFVWVYFVWVYRYIQQERTKNDPTKPGQICHNRDHRLSPGTTEAAPQGRMTLMFSATFPKALRWGEDRAG